MYLCKCIVLRACDIPGKSQVIPSDHAPNLLDNQLWFSPYVANLTHSCRILLSAGYVLFSPQRLLKCFILLCHLAIGLLQLSTARSSPLCHQTSATVRLVQLKVFRMQLYSLLSIFPTSFTLSHFESNKQTSPHLPEGTYQTAICIMFLSSLMHGLTWTKIPQDIRKTCIKTLLSGPPGGVMNSTWLPEWITVTFKQRLKAYLFTEHLAEY